MAGLWRIPICLILWFGWNALFHRNNLIANPSIPYIGLLLILCALIPRGEPLSFGKENHQWEMPIWIPRCAWILMAAGYTFSGITKLSSPSWIDGSAIGYLIENPLSRPGFVREILLHFPDPLIHLISWGTLFIELMFLPLALWKKSRPWIWLAMVCLHFGIILVVDFADLSLGMLLIHVFTFDPLWLKPKPGKLILAFDGDCLMCSRFIRFLVSEDRQKHIRITPLQGPLGEEMIASSGAVAMGTLIVKSGESHFIKSEAVRALFQSLGGIWQLLAILMKLIPRQARDSIYSFVAAGRHRWFKKTTRCSLPAYEIMERQI